MEEALQSKYQKILEQQLKNGSREGDAMAPRLANLLLVHAIRDRASDIHVEPKPEGLRIRFRIDGTLHDVLLIPSDEKVNLVPCFKVMAGIDGGSGGALTPKDGRINVRLGEIEADVRINAFPTLFGEKVALRILMKERDLVPLDQLGFFPKMLDMYNRLIRNPNGMILVTGPTGSGKTTTLYITLSEIHSPGMNICTLEDPVEYEVPEYNQAAINPRRGFTFAQGLRALLRQDPDIILVGEIRDEETAEVAVRGALTGHLILSTLHTSDVGSTVARLYDMGIDPYLIANCLRGIVAQRLARRLCPVCAQEDPIGNKWFSDRNLNKDFPTAKIHKPHGCPQCFGTGWKGRIGLFELLVVNEELRGMIGAHVSRTEIANLSASLGMPPLQYDGLRKVSAAITSLEEVLRLTQDY